MSYMKNIYIETIEETENLSTPELQNLLRIKNIQLGVEDELFEMLSDEQLITLIGEKNILLASK